MKKSQAANVFNNGLIMDLAPLVTPNDVMTDCLNGTLITYNGNENALQNDMGNARVETACLPEGFVPLGTAELGGVIYMVSYNPLEKVCQIGSFPSPERNISSAEVSKSTVNITDKSFEFTKEDGALKYTLKSEFGDELTFNPGDKFIVYGNIDVVPDKLYDRSKYDLKYDESTEKEQWADEDFNAARQQTLKFGLAAELDSGKLIKFENLHEYAFTTEDEKTYSSIIYNDTDVEKAASDTDIDGYRSLIKQPYNIYSSKASGKLVLLIELVQFSDFSVGVKHNFEDIIDIEKQALYNMYNPEITFTMSDDEDKFVPEGVHIEAELSYKGCKTSTKDSFDYDFTEEELKKLSYDKTDKKYSKDFKSYEIPTYFLSKLENIYNELIGAASDGYFSPTKKREKDKEYKLMLKMTPYMNWGKLPYLQREMTIDVDKINTGYINVTTWKYYLQKDDSIRFVWGLDCYPEDGYDVSGVTMSFIHSDDVSAFFNNGGETPMADPPTYNINGEETYHALFSTTFILDEKDSQLDNILKSKCLYLVRIEVEYYNEDSKVKYPKIFYKWMYTNGVFNSKFGTSTNFSDETLSFELEAMLSDVRVTDSISNSSKLGITAKQKKDDTSPTTADSLNNYQTDYTFNGTGTISIGLKEDYDSFSFVHSNKDDFTILSGDVAISTSSSVVGNSTEVKADNTKIVKEESATAEIEEEDTYNYYKVANYTKTALPENVVLWNSSLFGSSFAGDLQTYSITYKPKMLLSVKGDCSFESKARVFTGTLKPLAYDDETFDKYNLTRIIASTATETENIDSYIEDNIKYYKNSVKTTTYYQWVPNLTGLFAFHEHGGNSGQIALSCVDVSENKTVLDESNIGRLCQTIYSGERLPLHWTTRPEIISKELSDFENTAMFLFHLGGANGSGLQCRNAIGVNQWVSIPFQLIDDEESKYTGFFLFLRSKESDCYYPVSFVDSQHIENRESKTLGGIKHDYKIFTNMFAQVLNNLYHYESGSVSLPFWLPSNISYVASRQNKIIIPVCIKNGTEKVTVDSKEIEQSKTFDNQNIKIGNNCLDELCNVIKVKEPSIDITNLKATIQNLDDVKTVTITRSDSDSGIDILRRFEAARNDASGTVIYEHDGTTVLNEPDYYTRFDKNLLYCLYKENNKDPFKITSRIFKLRECVYYSEKEETKIDEVKPEIVTMTTTESAITTEGTTIKEPPSWSIPELRVDDQTGSGGKASTECKEDYFNIDYTQPLKVEYNEGIDINYKPTKDYIDVNLNDRFAVDDNGYLIVIPKGSSEFDMKTKSNNDSGTSTGYQKAYILNQYDLFNVALNDRKTKTEWVYNLKIQ